MVIGEDLLVADPIVPTRERGRVAIFHQPGRPAAIAESLAARLGESRLYELPDGEAAKDLDVAAALYRWLNDFGMTRSDTVVGVGGGAATDLAGYVAATYLRGIEAVYVPTTLLGAVDASVGGKTGVNVDGKNLVGVFAHPSRVVIDTAVLADLPAPVARQGHAEAVKAALIGSAELLALYETSGISADLETIVYEAIRVKAEVVTEDWREKGRRAILNYGHTVGHAVEVAGNLPHGDAIAIGMTVAARVSASTVGFEDGDRQESLLRSLGLPTRIPRLPVEDLFRLVGLDKKRDAVGLRMVLLERIGAPVVTHVDPETLTGAMVAVGAESQ